MQSRYLTSKLRRPSLSGQKFSLEPNWDLVVERYWQYDWVSILEFFHASKCLLYHRILIAYNDNNSNNNKYDNNNSIKYDGDDDGIVQNLTQEISTYVEQQCTCDSTAAAAAAAPSPTTTTTTTTTTTNNSSSSSTLEDIHFTKHQSGTGQRDTLSNVGIELQMKMDRITQVDQKLYKMAVSQFLTEIAWMESQLKRRVLCDDVLKSNEYELSYLNISVTKIYHEQKSRFSIK